MTQRPEKISNPQGKGLTPAVGYLVESSEGMRLPDVKDDSPSRIVEDYLSSLFVLSCDFRFRPVRNTVYHIYSHQGKAVLSLVSPEEGGTRIYDEPLGECCLKNDFSWSLVLKHELGEIFSFDDALSDF